MPSAQRFFEQADIHPVGELLTTGPTLETQDAEIALPLPSGTHPPDLDEDEGDVDTSEQRDIFERDLQRYGWDAVAF